MTKKDLFRLIIKIFGLYLVLSTLFSVLPGNVVYIFSQFDIIGIIWLIFVITVLILLFMFLIYKPDKIVEWLKLEKGFDEERIDFANFNNSNILKLAVIVICGILLVNNIPAFLSHTLFAFKSSFNSGYNDDAINFGTTEDYIYWATSFINILLGYLMLINYSYISKILKEKSENKSSD